MLPHIPQPFEFIHVKSYRDLPHLMMVIVLVLGIGLGVYLSFQPQIFKKQAAENSIVDLQFIPHTIPISTGTDYEARLAINPKGQRVTAVNLSLSYDPAVISVTEIKNGGFLPVDLRIIDDRQGNLNLIYGSTIEHQASQAGVLSVIKFRVLNAGQSALQVKSTSQISIASQEGNVLDVYPGLDLEPVGAVPGEEVKYPDNLLLEKAFFASSEPTVRDFTKSLEPQPELKPERVSPGFSGDYLKQLGKDIFVTPIAALNQVLEEKAGDILGR